MTKTGQQIEDDVFDLLKSGSLPALINGGVYLYGMRPKDSKAEDAIVKFVTGLDGQIQTGVVVINIYVPYYKEVKNIERCTRLEIAANEWVNTLTVARSDYRFSLMQTIYTEDAVSQHFVSVRLKFELFTL